MKTNPKQQFEEAIPNNIFYISEKQFRNDMISKCESISDQQAIEFAKWIATKDFNWTRNYNMHILWAEHVPITGAKAFTTQQLFDKFKKEFYSETNK